MVKKDRKVPKRKEFTFRGYKQDELQKMSLETLSEILPSRQRRKIKRGFKEEEKTFLKKIKEKETAKTHLRNMIVLPSMIGKKVGIHNGKGFTFVEIQPEMVGHYLGEFALTRKEVKHGSAGLGATKSSKFIPLR
ncbi:MAG: 30S ribosomal protein S19 [Candidatus Methanolliviera sp. GoM_oil]|nr:MAG: 30S ribosomal protein S19 [Candidatus Methanolliviera sp. GoM_oil]